MVKHILAAAALMLEADGVCGKGEPISANRDVDDLGAFAVACEREPRTVGTAKPADGNRGCSQGQDGDCRDDQKARRNER